MHLPIVFNRLAAALSAAAALMVAGVGQACDVATSASAAFGPFSPNAIKSGAAPYTANAGGFSCSSTGLLTLLSGNFLRATVTSASGLKLTASGVPNTISYVLSADAAGSSPFTLNTPNYYMNGTLLNLLGLFGPGTINVPIYVKPSNGTAVPPGTYTGQFQVYWEWYFCPGIGALGLCIGTVDAGAKTTTATVTLVVSPVSPVVQLSTRTTWDPIDLASNPKSIPGAKARLQLTVTNPDIAAMDADVIAIVAPTPAAMMVALDGDGASGASPIQFTDGSPASGLSLNYISAASAADDVEFSTDGGVTWTYAPVAGNSASQAAVTHIRLRPKGAMAAKSTITASIAYQMK